MTDHGRVQDAISGLGSEALIRAYHECVRRGDVERAARCGFWIVFALMNQGAVAAAAGWLGRARRLLDEGQRDCVERGYLLLPEAMRAVAEADFAGAGELARQAARIGDRFGEADLSCLAHSVQGRTAIRLGDIAGGVRLVDESMVLVTADEVSTVVAGTVYCAAIEACQETFDLLRAREWTAALNAWTKARPEQLEFRGRCLVHRAEILRLQGRWSEAAAEARRACEIVDGYPGVGGAAHYERAEVHRLRGELDPAERAYREASNRGREPQPGLALLWLARRRFAAAGAAIRRAAAEVHAPAVRPGVLAAAVEIILTTGTAAEAGDAAGELAEIAARVGTPYLRAMADEAAGTVLLGGGEPRPALVPLRRAWETWRDLDLPYHAARGRVLLARACRELGDEDTARMELAAARLVFARLGAAEGRATERTGAPLTGREVEVLRLVATGRTNRAIAEELVLSEKTVARHVSNILAKLGLPSRAAATAHAYEQEWSFLPTRAERREK